MSLPQFRIRTLMIAVAVLGVYAALLREFPEVGFWTVLLTAGPLLWAAGSRSRMAHRGTPVTHRRSTVAFGKAFAVNFGVVYGFLLVVSLLIALLRPDLIR